MCQFCSSQREETNIILLLPTKPSLDSLFYLKCNVIGENRKKIFKLIYLNEDHLNVSTSMENSIPQCIFSQLIPDMKFNKKATCCASFLRESLLLNSIFQSQSDMTSALCSNKNTLTIYI